jgi:hypothetical protein
MSNVSKKRQQDAKSSSSNTNKILLFVLIVVLFIGAFAGGRYYKNHKYDSFAKCLASKQAKMYGLFWCPHCADQKREFGTSFEYVPYVECAVKESDGKLSKELAPQCKAAGVKLFPSWQFGAEPPKEGVLSLEELSQKSGCSLP